MNAKLAVERYKAYRMTCTAYGRPEVLTLSQYMLAGQHLIMPGSGRYDGCTRN